MTMGEERGATVPELLDFSAKEPRRHYRWYAVLGTVLVLFLLTRTALSYYVDGLWYGSLGYAAVFRKTLLLQWGSFALFFAATFALLYGTFLAVKGERLSGIAGHRAIIVNGQPVTFNIQPFLQPIALLASAFLAYLSGSAMSSEWPTFARALYAPATTAAGSAAIDPILGRSVNFYLLTLPALQLVSSWLMVMAFLTLGIAGLFFALRSRDPARNNPLDHRYLTADTTRWRGLSFAVAFLLLNFALRSWLSRFEQLNAEHTVFSGVTYVDAHVLLPGMLLVCLVLLLSAGLAIYNGIRNRSGRWLAAAILPGILCYFALQAIGLAVSTFVVKPNELNKEQPYIAANIQFTRQAYALDTISLRPFEAQTTVAAADPANNQPTLQNIRLWDWHALQDTLRQIQEIRTYYDFPGIDIDRYRIDGSLRQVMLATRELSVEKLPESSRNWINERLIYTHGYGITMNPVNGFTAEGLPTLYLRDMPVLSTVPGLTLNRPEVYFGELTDTDVYVKTKQKEFNYPQGQSNSLTSYDGTGGIVLGSWLHRTLIAFERGDLGKLPFSDDITPDSRLLMRRNIRDRIQTLAPFLTLDPDPYIVVGDDGRLSWIVDAFTTADSYPYARHYNAGDSNINYVRNSVKITVDAYNGATNFYVFDPQDPILGAYRNIFPTLFRDASTMPADLRKHIRYPELLLKLQAEAYGLYHMTNPETFFNREDLWTPATESGVDVNGQRTAQAMDPNFVLMRLPDERDTEFVNILPFTPANRNNLIGWIAGRSDGPHYGTAVVYNFPKTKLVDGPLQIEARIDQNAQISGQLTLWNQQGSHVRRGNLLVIPTGSALLYAEAIYLQAERSPMPELRLVVLALQDRLAYGTTFEAAMQSLFNGTDSSITATATPVNAAQTNANPANSSTSTNIPLGEHPANPTNVLHPATLANLTTRDQQIHTAAQDLADYQRLTAEGKLAEAGAKLDHLKQTLNTLNTRPN